MTKPSIKRQCGFTMIEALAACVLLGLAVTSICALGSRSLSQAMLNRQYDQAWQILDCQFTVLDQIGLEEFMFKGQTQGPVPEHIAKGTATKYYWQAQISDQDEDNLYDVTFTISWQHRNKLKSISSTTLLNGQNATSAL